MQQKRRLAVAITGATGAGFAVALLQRLAASELVEEVTLMLSIQGRRCIKEECQIDENTLAGIDSKISLQNESNLYAPISSGSHLHHGLVILPCSAGTLGRIASGISDTLITRAADVCLKEKRPLILCLRESPLNRVHIENMLRLFDAGAIVMPLMPTYYHNPESINDLFDAFATRILDQLGIYEADSKRWGIESH